MSKLYFTSDTHFFSCGILSRRKSKTVRELNETTIAGWNAVIGKGDTVYIVGDFINRYSREKRDYILKRLNGEKYLIKGNHDTGFQGDGSDIKVLNDCEMVEYKGYRFLLCHYPVWEERNERGERMNRALIKKEYPEMVRWFDDDKSVSLYGHYHYEDPFLRGASKRFKLMCGRVLNVCFDMNQQRPLSADEIIEKVF